MAKKAKKKKVKTPKVQEFPGMTGPGVEVLHIQAIEDAADAYKELDEALSAAKEARGDAEKVLKDVMRANIDKLPMEPKGGHSYRYGNQLVKLRPTSEKVSVTTVHDEATGPEEN